MAKGKKTAEQIDTSHVDGLLKPKAPRGKKAETVKAEDTPVKGKDKKAAAEEQPVFRSVHADLPKRPIVWSERRIAVVTALRDLGAVSPSTAVTAGEIAAKAGIDDVYRVKVVCDVYRQNELHHGGVVASVRGGRELKYHLTKVGQKVKMTPPSKKGEEGTEE